MLILVNNVNSYCQGDKWWLLLVKRMHSDKRKNNTKSRYRKKSMSLPIWSDKLALVILLRLFFENICLKNVNF